MSLFHFHVTQVKRSAGQFVVTSAAYRAGEKLYSEYYGETSDYTRKGGVICSDIFLPSHVPPEYKDRATLWNAVERAERGKKAQLAYSFDIALSAAFPVDSKKKQNPVALGYLSTCHCCLGWAYSIVIFYDLPSIKYVFPIIITIPKTNEY